MKKMNRKGFTIVELVIVIAVIAILAGVLIPTFSGIIQKANDSAILQEAKNLYTSYMAAVDYAAGESAETTAYIKVEKSNEAFYVKVEGASVKETIYTETEVEEAMIGKILIEKEESVDGVAWERVYCAQETDHDYSNGFCSKCTKAAPVVDG